MHATNPAMRSTSPAEEYWKSATSMSEADCHAALTMSLPQPLVTQESSNRLLVAMARFFGKMGLGENTPYFEICRGVFDAAIADEMSHIVQKHTVQSVGRKYRVHLGLLMSLEDLDSLLAALEKEEPMPTACLRRVLVSSACGKLLFSSAGHVLKYTLFKELIDQHISDLKHIDFDNDEVQRRRVLIDSEGRKLLKDKVITLENKGCELQWFGRTTVVRIDAPVKEFDHKINRCYLHILLSKKAAGVPMHPPFGILYPW